MNEYEKWSVIVDDFTKYRTAKEVTIQRLWEEYFLDPDIFGFSVRKGEIDIHRVMRIGSKERTIPDIIIHDSDSGKDLFIIICVCSSRRRGKRGIYSKTVEGSNKRCGRRTLRVFRRKCA